MLLDLGIAGLIFKVLVIIAVVVIVMIEHIKKDAMAASLVIF
jgi:hypothetical protein